MSHDDDVTLRTSGDELRNSLRSYDRDCALPQKHGTHPRIATLAAGDVWLSVKESAQLLNEPQRTIQHRCKADHYVVRAVAVRGGERYEILLSSLPDSAQVRYWQQLTATKWQTMRPEPRKLSEKARQVALLRADLIRLYLEDCERERIDDGSMVARKKLFARRYNAGEWPDLLEALGTTSYPTLERWRKTLVEANHDPLSLAPQYQSKRGAKGEARQRVTPRHAEILLRHALAPNRLKLAEVIRLARREFAMDELDNHMSDSVLRRWLQAYQSANADLWTLMREGEKALNDRVSPYIIRDRNAVEIGDLVTADGHVMNIDILNPETGKPKRMTLVLVYDFRTNFPLGWEIMPTENTMAIASAYRHAILRLGFAPRVFYLDNGKAFRARYFSGVKDFRQAGLDGLFERIGSRVTHAQPYHGQSKTVERFFGSLAEFERRTATYTGTSIAHKPAHLLRGESFMRSLQRGLGGCTLTLRDAHLMLADWMDEYVQRPQQDGALAGRTPLDALEESLDTVKRQPDFASRQVDPATLQFLMMTSRVTKLYRNGIQHGGSYYYHDALYELEKSATQRLVIRYDLQSDATIHVYTTDGEYVCEAHRAEAIHPAASTLGTDNDRAALTAAIHQHKTLKAHTISSAKAFVQGLQQETSSTGTSRPQETPDRGATEREKPLLLTTAPPFDEIEPTPRLKLFESDLDDDTNPL